MAASALTIEEMSASLTGRSLRAERTLPAEPEELLVARAAPWLDGAARKVASFLLLKPGWDSYGAAPVSFSTVYEALQLIVRFQAFGVPAPEIVPTSRGGVQFEWEVGGTELEIEVRPDGCMLAVFEDENGESWDRELPRNDLAGVVPALERLARLGRSR